MACFLLRHCNDAICRAGSYLIISFKHIRRGDGATELLRDLDDLLMILLLRGDWLLFLNGPPFVSGFIPLSAHVRTSL